MKFNRIATACAAFVLAFDATASFASTVSSDAIAANTKNGDRISTAAAKDSATFFCDTRTSTPKTVVRQSDGSEKTIVYWMSNYFPNPTAAQQMCQQVAAQLQNYYNGGQLMDSQLAVAQMGGQSVACLQDSATNNCTSDRVLFPLNANNEPADLVFTKLTTNPFNEGSLRIRRSVGFRTFFR